VSVPNQAFVQLPRLNLSTGCILQKRRRVKRRASRFHVVKGSRLMAYRARCGVRQLPVWFNSMLYFSGSYLFNPQDTNGITSWRIRFRETILSRPTSTWFGVASLMVCRGCPAWWSRSADAGKASRSGTCWAAARLPASRLCDLRRSRRHVFLLQRAVGHRAKPAAQRPGDHERLSR